MVVVQARLGKEIDLQTITFNNTQYMHSFSLKGLPKNPYSRSYVSMYNVLDYTTSTPCLVCAEPWLQRV